MKLHQYSVGGWYHLNTNLVDLMSPEEDIKNANAIFPTESSERLKLWVVRCLFHVLVGRWYCHWTWRCLKAAWHWYLLVIWLVIILLLVSVKLLAEECHLTQVNTPPPQPQPVSWYSIYLRWRDGRLSWPRLLAGNWTRDLPVTSPTA